MSRLILGMDTTGSYLNLGLDDFAGIHRMESLPLGRALSTDLHACLQAFMGEQSLQDLAAIAVVVGPGSYTGSRMGVVTARTLAQALDIPLYGFTSLAIAASISESKSDKIAISIPAQRNHIYGAIYQLQSGALEPQTIKAESNCTIEAWQSFLKGESLESVEFEYSENTSIQMLEKMIAIARHKLSDSVDGHWENIYPNYAK